MAWAVLVWMLLGVGGAATASAAPPGSAPQRPDGVRVDVAVRRDDHGEFVYDYEIVSAPRTADAIVRVELEVTRRPHEADLPDSGALVPSHTRGATALLRSRSIAVVPTSAAAPPGWAVGLGLLRNRPGRGWLMWGTAYRQAFIWPGEYLAGFQVVSPGLPSLRVVQLKPDFNLALLPPGATDDLARVEALRDEATASFTTVGPGAPPATEGSAEVLARLAESLETLRLLRWIKSAETAATLDATLASVRRHLREGNGQAARVAALEFQTQVVTAGCAQAPCWGRPLNHEAYAVLFFGADYLLHRWRP